jgi:hypothetical protein
MRQGGWWEKCTNGQVFLPAKVVPCLLLRAVLTSRHLLWHARIMRWRNVFLSAFVVLPFFTASCGTNPATPDGSGGSSSSGSNSGGSGGEVSDAGSSDASDAAPPPQSTFTDPVHSLMWQKSQSFSAELWIDAGKYCDNLNWAGYSDWRLPTIDELRTIIIGCPNSESGGACSVGANCLPETCGGSICDGCPGSQGPTAGCYRIVDLDGDCTAVWSSSVDPGSPIGAWYVNFSNARIRYDDQALYHSIRCVRSLP